MGIIVLVVISASSATSEQKLAQIASVYPEKLKPLLKEEFPEYSDMFTTLFCSLFWTELLVFAKQKTKQNDDLKALQKLNNMFENSNKKEILEDEFLEAMRRHYHPEFYKMLREDAHQREKLDRATDLAGAQTLSELS